MIKALLLSKHFTQAVNDKLIEFSGKGPNTTKIAFCQDAASLLKETQDTLPFIELAKEELRIFGYSFDQFSLYDYIRRPKELLDYLSNYDATFFTGGSHQSLLDAFYKSGLITEYTGLLENGLIHIGFSAGAMVCSGDLKYYKPIRNKHYSGKIYDQGLGIFEHYIIPHYQTKPKYTRKFEEHTKSFKDEPVKFIPLTDEQAVCINGENWNIIQ